VIESDRTLEDSSERAVFLERFLFYHSTAAWTRTIITPTAVRPCSVERVVVKDDRFQSRAINVYIYIYIYIILLCQRWK